MQKISEIYEQYKIMSGLREHMLRVASVARVICHNMNLKVDKDLIVTSALLHDMGNIIKSNLDLFPEFLEPEGLDYWSVVKAEYLDKYGSNEHVATIAITQEIGVSNQVIDLLENLSFKKLCEHAKNDDFQIKILQYSDMRVGPHGILSYRERMLEGIERYKNRKDYADKIHDENEKYVLYGCGEEIEKQIFAKCKINPEHINDEYVAPVIEELRNFVIK